MKLAEKLLMFTLVWLFTVGQSQAVAMSCEHQNAGSHHQMSMQGDDTQGGMRVGIDSSKQSNGLATHDHHMMTSGSHSDSVPNSQPENNDCCSDDCACPAGLCASLAIANSTSQSNHYFNNHRFLAQQIFVPNSLLATLYRPPINA